MAAPQLSEAYVLGLFADLQEAVPKLGEELAQAQRRAAAVDGELSNVLRRLDNAREVLSKATAVTKEAASVMAARNTEIATMHQEIATFGRRIDQLKEELLVIDQGPAARQLRRERGRLRVEIEEREQTVAQLKAEVSQARAALRLAEEDAVNGRDRERAVLQELDALQSQLPSPQLYINVFEAATGRAHCRLHLDRDTQRWGRDLKRAVRLMLDLHTALRTGKYRLDAHSEILGGRAVATGEALFAAIVLGARESAGSLFAQATDENLLFHQIFNVFRVWCAGLYITGARQELVSLLRPHRYAEGIRGAYVEAFSGLLARDQGRVAAGIRDIARHEWELWQDPRRVRALGLVNLGVVAVLKLAREAGLRVSASTPTVPEGLLGAFWK